MNIDTTKERIIQEALFLFAESDYKSVSMENIATAVGIKKASLYFHYLGKEDIYNNVLDYAITEFIKLNNEITTKSLIKQNLYSALYSYLKEYIEYVLNKTVLQFWTRMYILPPKHLTAKDMEKCNNVDSMVFNSIKSILTKYHRVDCNLETLTLFRLAGGYVSIGTELGENMPPWQDELAAELNIIITGIINKREA